MERKIVESRIEIFGSAGAVWNVLTNPRQTAKYMFGCQALSGWAAGDALDWEGEYEGKKMIFVKGKILEIDHDKKLVYTVIDPNSGMPDLPQNYLRVTYELTDTGDRTWLTVTQDGFEEAADGEKRYLDTYNNGQGWDPILDQIKAIVEAG